MYGTHSTRSVSVLIYLTEDARLDRVRRERQLRERVALMLWRAAQLELEHTVPAASAGGADDDDAS